MVKDYYRILELTPQATPEEIRRSYRRLAMEWHPDRKGENPLYMDIREAYETLIDPDRKDAYLRSRTDEEHLGRRFENRGRPTPSSIMAKALEMEREVSATDGFRIDGESLLNTIEGLLDTRTIEVLEQETDDGYKRHLTGVLVKCGRPLDRAKSERLAGILDRMGDRDAECRRQVEAFVTTKRSEERWERWRLPLLIAATLLLCLLISLAGP
jgi:curved DNA-binding protein CbpA